MKVIDSYEIEMDDCLGFYIDLICDIYEDKKVKYVIKKEFYKYDQPEIEVEYFDTEEEARKIYDEMVEEYG